MALFVCPALGLREVIPVRAPLENAVVVADRPFLRPLAAAEGETPPTLVVFIDAESARLIPVLDAGPGEEVRLESDVPGHHRRGGWAQLALGHYQRHIEERRGRHLEAVAEALGRIVEEQGVERIVIAGSSDSAAAFQRTSLAGGRTGRGSRQGADTRRPASSSPGPVSWSAGSRPGRLARPSMAS